MEIQTMATQIMIQMEIITIVKKMEQYLVLYGLMKIKMVKDNQMKKYWRI